MLSDFFRINMPYGIARNDNGEWLAFNREYLPIGFNSSNYKDNFHINDTSNFPIHTSYKGLTEKKLLSLAGDDASAIKRNDDNEIITVFFYSDGTNPVNQSSDDRELWKQYFDKLKVLSVLDRK